MIKKLQTRFKNPTLKKLFAGTALTALLLTGAPRAEATPRNSFIWR